MRFMRSGTRFQMGRYRFLRTVGHWRLVSLSSSSTCFIPHIHPIFGLLRCSRSLPVPRNVSFRYPSSGDFALRDVSFKIEKGQLCVSPVLLVSAFRCMPDSQAKGYRWDQRFWEEHRAQINAPTVRPHRGCDTGQWPGHQNVKTGRFT